MSFNKLNVLHWHALDDNSWPLLSESYPEFAHAGAYCNLLRCMYSPSDVALIHKEALLRGIVILMEFEMPAHASVWSKAFKNTTLSCSNSSLSKSSKILNYKN